MERSRAEAIVELGLRLRRKKLGPDATILDAARDWHRETSETFKRRWEATDNPIWVWRALARLNALSIHTGNLHPEHAGAQFLGAVPEWCAAYLLECAYRIEHLAALRDFRRVPHGERLHAVDGSLTPEAAAELLPTALRFTRQGWSAFREYRDEDLLRLMLTVHELDPAAVTFESIMEAMGWTDERNARRKFAKIRRGRT